MKPHLLRFGAAALLLCLSTSSCLRKPGMSDLVEAYIKAWVVFYPSQALANGHLASATRFEDFSEKRVETWVVFNQRTFNTIQTIKGEMTPDERDDARLLLRQASMELERWKADESRTKNPRIYAGVISQAMTHLLVRERLTPQERLEAVQVRLLGVEALSNQAAKSLDGGSAYDLERAVASLSASVRFIEGDLGRIVGEWGDARKTGLAAQQTARSLRALIEHLRGLTPDRQVILGHDTYARKLAAYTDRELTPEDLATSALQEIDRVRDLILEQAKAHWAERYPDEAAPADEDVVARVMEDMENHRVSDNADLEAQYRELTDAAEAFVRDRQLATLPEPRTLWVGQSPRHFAGAAIGGVYPGGPFDPEAETLFYIPAIHGDPNGPGREGFFRSFNNHFNEMIIGHEMFPGHYLQFRVAAAQAPPVRTLFADPVNVEGWGSFCEELMWAHGWAEDDRLTYVAHLRKRLENAVRAYTSVMVHSEGWNKERLSVFAVERGLLPPQFSENLWYRVLTSPFQLTTYFVGFHDFKALYAAEQARLGEQFVVRDFVDGVLRAGALPVDALGPILAGRAP